MGAHLLGRAEQSTPKAQRGAPLARGVDGESARRAIMAHATDAPRPRDPEQNTLQPPTTRSARGCHPCLRYDLLPMCPGRTVYYWWAVTDSNRRHPACKTGALPTELTAPWQALAKFQGPARRCEQTISPLLRRRLPPRKASTARNCRQGDQAPLQAGRTLNRLSAYASYAYDCCCGSMQRRHKNRGRRPGL
jgi:hypothetical protein